MRIILLFVFSTWLMACTAPSPKTLSSQFSTMSTSALWTQHLINQSPLELAYIEAELGTRGQSYSGSSYLGRRTSAVLGRHLYAREGAKGNDRNCSDFPSSAAAQKFFLTAGGPFRDPNNLDADGDGLACEWGTSIRQIATTRSAPVISIRPRYTASGCHVGPRGGTYTITASGHKNYNGC